MRQRTESRIDTQTLAWELMTASSTGQMIVLPPSARDPDFCLNDAYAVESELARLRRANGRATVGRKVGYANKALWRILKLETVVWANMYDYTVHYAPGEAAKLSMRWSWAPKIEPEVVFKLKKPLETTTLTPEAALDAVEWLALGFEIIDCPFPNWQFQPVDFVAAFGFHKALVVGQPRPVQSTMIETLVEELARFKVGLARNDQLVEEGTGKNVLRSPALCLAELAAAVARQSVAAGSIDNDASQTRFLQSGEIISTGSLTTSQPVAVGETWSAVADGLDVPSVTLRLIE